MRHENLAHYDVLGVAHDATPSEIKQANRRLARQTHPDVARGDLATAEAQFKEVTHAYNVLSNAASRAEYDASLAYGFSESVYTDHYSYVYVSSDDQELFDQIVEERLAKAWQLHISTPLDWIGTVAKLYGRFQWVLALIFAAIGIAVVVSGNANSMFIWRIILTTRSAPDIESMIPLTGLVIGVVLATVFTVATIWHAAMVNRESFANNRRFRSVLWHLGNKVFAGTVIIGALTGLLIGHFLF